MGLINNLFIIELAKKKANMEVGPNHPALKIIFMNLIETIFLE